VSDTAGVTVVPIIIDRGLIVVGGRAVDFACWSASLLFFSVLSIGDHGEIGFAPWEEIELNFSIWEFCVVFSFRFKTKFTIFGKAWAAWLAQGHGG